MATNGRLFVVQVLSRGWDMKFTTKDVASLKLPDGKSDAIYWDDDIAGFILGMSERTVRYHPHLPRVQISRGRYGQRVGDIRKLARKGMVFADLPIEAQEIIERHARFDSIAVRKAQNEAAALKHQLEIFQKGHTDGSPDQKAAE